MSLNLDPKTVQLMREAVQGKVCDDCGEQAVRLTWGVWYCLSCWHDRYARPYSSHNGMIRTLNDPRPAHARPRLKCV